MPPMMTFGVRNLRRHIKRLSLPPSEQQERAEKYPFRPSGGLELIEMPVPALRKACLLYTSDAADDM
eukprot:1124799-Alexandrium_andersonii.AAC.1